MTQPDALDPLLEQGIAHQRKGELGPAEQCYKQLLRQQPQHAVAMGFLGLVAQQRKDLPRAEMLLARAVEMDGSQAANWCSYGAILMAMNRAGEALRALRTALGLNPGMVNARVMLADALMGVGKWEEAIEAYQTALKQKPDYRRALLNLSIAYHRLANFAEAKHRLQDMLTRYPDWAEGAGALLVFMHYEPEATAQELFDAAVSWGGRFTPASLRLPPAMVDNDAHRVLRIGYVSADFNKHPVGFFMENVLKAHDAKQVQVYAYANQSLRDGLTQRLEPHATWRNIYGVSDEQATMLIREDKIDILVDLSGHTAGNRLTMLARKPAPVQMTWLGYYDTTGMQAIDYIIADETVIPTGQEGYFTETPLRLPDSYLCFSPPEFDIPVAELPSEGNGYITFGSFNRFEKLTETTLDCWVELLRRVPGSKLALSLRVADKPGLMQPFLARFAKAGVGAERLVLTGLAPRQELMARYNEVDIALDPFPYSGGTTTVEALWMGVPVVTWPQQSFASRVSASIVRALGEPELACASREDYIEKAVALAEDKNRLRELRTRLRPQMQASPLCDAARFTRNLEAAYRQAWRKFVADAAG